MYGFHLLLFLSFFSVFTSVKLQVSVSFFQSSGCKINVPHPDEVGWPWYHNIPPFTAIPLEHPPYLPQSPTGSNNQVTKMTFFLLFLPPLCKVPLNPTLHFVIPAFVESFFKKVVLMTIIPPLLWQTSPYLLMPAPIYFSLQFFHWQW